MVTQYGMSDKLGPLTYGERESQMFLGQNWTESRTYSDEVATIIDAEVKKIVTDARDKAKEILTAHKDLLRTIADRLIKEETIEGEAFEKMFEPLDKELKSEKKPAKA
jgi:cell division protease FtsH